MGFFAEYISAADMERYEIKKIDEQVEISWRTKADDWVIDRERNMYLRCVAEGREDLSRESGWSFYWNGVLFWVYIELIECSANGRNAPGWARKKVVEVRLMDGRKRVLPSDFLGQRDVFMKNLEEALVAYKDGGVYSATTEYRLFLEVAEGAMK